MRSAGGVSWGDSKSDKRVRICGEASVGDKNTSDNLVRRELLLSGRAIATRCLPELEGQTSTIGGIRQQTQEPARSNVVWEKREHTREGDQRREASPAGTHCVQLC